MKTNQAWGWLAAGVMALGLNGFYQDGGAAWAHRAVSSVVDRVEERTGPALAMLTGRVEWLAASNRARIAREETSSCRFATAMARVQTRMARTHNSAAQFEAMSARREALVAKLEAERARMEADRSRIEARFERMRFSPAIAMTKTTVACPRVRVSIPRVSIPDLSEFSPEVRVNISGAGPI